MSDYFLTDAQVKELSQHIRKETLEKATKHPTAKERVIFNMPTKEEIQTVIGLTGLLKGAVSLEVGVNGKTIRKWQNGDTAITFASWRIICGLVVNKKD